MVFSRTSKFPGGRALQDQASVCIMWACMLAVHAKPIDNQVIDFRPKSATRGCIHELQTTLNSNFIFCTHSVSTHPPHREIERNARKTQAQALLHFRRVRAWGIVASKTPWLHRCRVDFKCGDREQQCQKLHRAWDIVASKTPWPRQRRVDCKCGDREQQCQKTPRNLLQNTYQ